MHSIRYWWPLLLLSTLGLLLAGCSGTSSGGNPDVTIGTVTFDSTSKLLTFKPKPGIMLESGYGYARFTLVNGADGSETDINGLEGVRLTFTPETETWVLDCSGAVGSDLYNMAQAGTYNGTYRIAVYAVRTADATPELVSSAQTVLVNFTIGGGTVGPPPPPW